MNKLFVFFVIILINTLSYGVAQNSLTGKVYEIISPNSFKIETKDTTSTIVLEDALVIVSDSIAISYLKEKILNQNVIVVPSKIESGNIYASILYNCEKLKGVSYDDIPCSSGNVLNIEMIRNGYLKYTGDNKFLLQLSEQKKK
jgi:hypothetical protein